MVAQKYRWDFIGLSTDQKPTPATSDKVVDGSTFYCSDNSKLYVFCKDTWYERKALGSGGGGGTTYTAGTGIDITDDTISVDTDTIQEKLTAGSNITISDNTIAATDTTYSNFTGTDGTAAGAAGLVPAPATTDAGKFLKADGTWDTAGGGGDTVYSTKTTSDLLDGGAVYIGNKNSSQQIQPDPTTTDNHWRYFWALPYTNNEVPSSGSINIFGQNSGNDAISLGMNAVARLEGQIAIGRNALNNYSATNGVAIGQGAQCLNAYSVSLGKNAKTTRNGEINVGAGSNGIGYNSTNYRVIGGVHDGQNNHDAATVAQGNTLATSAPTTSTVGVLGQLYTDTTNMHTYQCTAISGDTYTWTQRW